MTPFKTNHLPKGSPPKTIDAGILRIKFFTHGLLRSTFKIQQAFLLRMLGG